MPFGGGEPDKAPLLALRSIGDMEGSTKREKVSELEEKDLVIFDCATSGDTYEEEEEELFTLLLLLALVLALLLMMDLSGVDSTVLTICFTGEEE